MSAASGFAGLGLQIVWVQQASVWLGHESAAVLAVVAAFFGGLAVGALWLAPALARRLSAARAYALCEFAIAGWSVVLAGLLGPVGAAMLQLIGARPAPLWQGVVAFAGTFVLLLPATAAMGATLPTMADLLARLGGSAQPRPRALAVLYASNTAGAVLGVLSAAFCLVPGAGLLRTAAVCALLNLACAARVLAAARAPQAKPAAPTPTPPFAAGERGVLATLFSTGLLGIGYEVLVVRVLSQVTENTVYTFALLLAAYVVGSALGAAAWPHLGERWRARLLPLQAAACLAGAGTLWAADGARRAVLQLLGGGLEAALTAEAALAVLAFALPTVVMGALFAELASRAQSAGAAFARAVGVNTLGAALAPPLFGVVVAPAIGPKLALLLVVAGYTALALPAVDARRGVAVAAGAAALVALLAPPLLFVDLPQGGRLLSYRDGTMAAVSVVEDAAGVATLRINNRQQEGSSATAVADARQALLPLLLHSAPTRALFVGLGTGVTAASAALDPTLQVEAVELLPEVVEASARFVPAGARQRLRVTVADARRFVRTSDERYDVIVADNVHPARSGTGALYTREHFESVRARLTPGGLFCQWLPLHQLDLDTLRSIVRSFQAAFPQAHAMLATNSLATPVLGLVARADGALVDLPALRARLAAPTTPLPLSTLDLDDPLALLGGFVAGPRALAAFAADAPLNSDDRPVVAYRAPRVTYAPADTPADRLLALLPHLGLSPGEWPLRDPAFAARLAAYWAARDQFLAAGRAVQPSADVRQILAQVREPLLAVLRTSPDFRPAYDPLLRMAATLAARDPWAARALLVQLRQIQPARQEAGALLAWLGTPPD